jgi:coatomer subunit beta'
VQKYFDQGVEVSDQGSLEFVIHSFFFQFDSQKFLFFTGIEDGFELEHEIAEKVQTGRFVGDCFIFNTGNRLNYFIGGQVVTLAHLDRTMYVLGYLQKENRVYLTDKQHNIVSYQLLLSVLVYQTAIVRRDFETGV